MTTAAQLGELVPKQELVKAFGVNQSTVGRWVNAGRLPKPIRPGGGRAYFKRADIERLLNGEGVAVAQDTP